MLIPVNTRMAHDEAMFTPPHLWLNETVWAVVKRGEDGRQKTIDTGFKVVLQCLEDTFYHLKVNTVQGCICKAYKNLRRLWSYIKSMEDVYYESGDDSDEDMMSSNGFSEDEESITEYSDNED